MIRALLRIRYLAVVVAVVFVIHAIGFLALGVHRGLQVYRPLLRGAAPEQHPGRHIAESVDALLFSLVLVVLAVGTVSLFLTVPGKDESNQVAPWMRIKSLTDLKLLLWEAILAMLVVTAAAGIIGDLPDIAWTSLVTPAAILMLSVSYYVLKRGESKS